MTAGRRPVQTRWLYASQRVQLRPSPSPSPSPSTLQFLCKRLPIQLIPISISISISFSHFERNCRSPTSSTLYKPCSSQFFRRKDRILPHTHFRNLSLSLCGCGKALKMFRLSNNLVGFLNFVTFLLSVPILGAGIWLAHRASTDCEKFLEKPVIALGVFLMVVSLAGLVGACCGISWLLWVYLLVMFLLIVVLFCFTVFAFVVTNSGAGKVVSNRGYKEYRLGDYSNWLQKRVNNTKNWNKIKSCLIDSKVCSSLADKSGNDTLDQFYAEHLSALQSGCCKPSDDCGFTYVSPIVWTVPAGTTTYNNSDCSLWSNDAKVLCYNCQSCKAGLLDNIKTDWKKVAVVNVIFLVFLIIVYSVGCCAFRNNREDNAFWKRRPYP